MRRVGLVAMISVMSSMCGHIAAACPVCYGANDSPMTAGMNTAILVMLGITGFVLVLIAAFFVWLWRKSRPRRVMLSHSAFVDERGSLQTNNEKGVIEEWNNS